MQFIAYEHSVCSSLKILQLLQKKLPSVHRHSQGGLGGPFPPFERAQFYKKLLKNVKCQKQI